MELMMSTKMGHTASCGGPPGGPQADLKVDLQADLRHPQGGPEGGPEGGLQGPSPATVDALLLQLVSNQTVSLILMLHSSAAESSCKS